MHEVAFYEKLENRRARCHLCPHNCRIAPGKRGVCGVRENRDGVLWALNYGRVSAQAFDPVEKKPLFHFYPGSVIYSLGTVGCSFHCEFCQNWEIARGAIAGTFALSVEDVVGILRQESATDCIGVAYTYSEPLMWYEFVLPASRLVREAGYKNVLVTNGFINEEPLRLLLPQIDALNIDVKGFTNRFYRRLVHGSYEPVLRTAVLAREAGCHVEITTLLIPGLNDGDEELQNLVGWVRDALGPETPLHFSRYFPNYRLQLEPTPMAVLQRAWEIARRQLSYVYLGNVTDTARATTYCPHCHRPVVERMGYQVRLTGLQGRYCKTCGRPLPFVVREGSTEATARRDKR